MEKDLGRISKNEQTDIIVRIDDFGGKRGVTIREFVKSDKYTGFTKAGTRIPADKFLAFREIINSLKIEELKQESDEEQETLDNKEEAEDKGGEDY